MGRPKQLPRKNRPLQRQRQVWFDHRRAEKIAAQIKAQQAAIEAADRAKANKAALQAEKFYHNCKPAVPLSALYLSDKQADAYDIRMTSDGAVVVAIRVAGRSVAPQFLLSKNIPSYAEKIRKNGGSNKKIWPLPLQQLGAKVHTAIIIRSREGVGKDTFGKLISSPYGLHAIMLDNNDLNDRFNPHMDGILQCRYQEIGDSSGKVRHLLLNLIKHWVTGEVLRINPKNINARMRKTAQISYFSPMKHCRLCWVGMGGVSWS
jgi:hypothetical protein